MYVKMFEKKKDIAKRSKQIVHPSQDQYKTPLCRNNLFHDKQIILLTSSRLYAKEFTFS